MPVVAVSAKRLNQLLGREYPMKELVHALDQLGCDVEDTAEMKLYRCPACQSPNEKLSREEPASRCDFCGFESDEPFPLNATERVIRLDLLADRPDLFDAGGLSRALKGYLGLEKGLTEFQMKQGDIKVEVDPALSEKGTYRPYIACAVVETPPMDQDSLREIMRLQENLHWGIGRDRKLASIGVYDMDTIVPPIRYTLVDPESFQFHPLGMPGQNMTPHQILAEHPKGKAYAGLMDEYSRCPILIDSRDLVLAMPPIINSDETKCKTGTTRLFIDVTGAVPGPVNNSLNTLVSALIELGGRAETVTILHPGGPEKTPDLSPKSIAVRYDKARRWLGLDFSRREFVDFLEKMRLDVEEKDDAYLVHYPVFRTDVRHEVDIFEDAAIGYGYENIPPRLVESMTIGEARPEERISQTVRDAMTGLGFTEIMTLNLHSKERLFGKFRMEPGSEHIIVQNPKTIQQKVVRCHLMPGIMETFQKNRRKPVPQKIFELGNILTLNSEAETGVEEYRHLAFGIIGPESGYAGGRSVLDAVLSELGLKGAYKPASHPSFFEGRCAEVTDQNSGWLARLGEVHPEVITNFSLAYPILLCELRLWKVI